MTFRAHGRCRVPPEDRFRKISMRRSDAGRPLVMARNFRPLSIVREGKIYARGRYASVYHRGTSDGSLHKFRRPGASPRAECGSRFEPDPGWPGYGDCCEREGKHHTAAATSIRVREGAGILERGTQPLRRYHSSAGERRWQRRLTPEPADEPDADHSATRHSRWKSVSTAKMTRTTGGAFSQQRRFRPTARQH